MSASLTASEIGIDEGEQQPVRRSPLLWAACCWMVGIVLGRQFDLPWSTWLVLAVAAAMVAWAGQLAVRSKARAASATRSRYAALAIVAAAFTVVASAGAWWEVRTLADDELLPTPAAAGDRRTLIELEGIVTRPARQRVESPGLMGRFDYRGPGTSLWVRIEQVSTGGDGLVGINDQAEPARLAGAVVLVSVPAYEDRPRAGDRLRLRGWLSGFRAASNPGERDFRRTMAERGVIGRVAVGGRGNIELLKTVEEDAASPLARTLERARRGARLALRQGLPLETADAPSAQEDAAEEESPARHTAETLGLLEALLLGDRNSDMEELEEAFADTGLTHLLAISGLHLGILAAGTWMLALAITGRPTWALVISAVVVAGYIVMVPARVPIIRAGVMTLAAVGALGSGRRLAAMATLSAAALLLLIWRPWDLFTAGFQLSFLVVAALVLYARPVSQWMLGPAALERWSTKRFLLRRYGVDYLAVSLVAWCAAMPLVAWHFGRVSPIAMLMAVAMLPFVAALLWFGYLKILLTAFVPTAGAVIATPLWWLAELTVAIVRTVATWPIATIEVGSVSGWWSVSALGVAAATMGGSFAGRRWAMLSCLALLVGWLAVTTSTQPAVRAVVGHEPGLKLNMFSVGDGGAILVRSGGEAWLYDCGSANYLDITTAAVGPALDELGVRKIDTVVLSHPDLDHFSGVLELVDRYAVPRVVLSEQFIARAEGSAGSAARFTLDALRDRDLHIDRAAAGWAESFGKAEVEAVWPPPEERFDHSNDGSLVLRFTVAGRRVMLTGDIQQEAMTRMLEAERDLRADVVDLPHHGSWTAAGPDWLAAVSPAVLLQSSGDVTMSDERWRPHIEDIENHVTGRHGMIEVRVDRDGRIHRRRFRDESAGWGSAGRAPLPPYDSTEAHD